MDGTQDEVQPIDALLGWGLAAFQTALFVAVGVLLLYRYGSLGERLADLNSFLGLLLFVLLWITTFAATKRGLRQARMHRITRRPIEAVFYATVWGGVDGALFFALLVAGILPFAMLRAESLQQAGALLVFLPFVLGVGGFAASIVGAFLGMAFGVVEAIIVVAARSIASVNLDAESA